ncbi:hypothetical protein O6H91_06G015400 [Diphasiastrum complanatum]|uniref:Uncharacterized protein n=1 Tax=Diphasiastrum complanatum TaxID=34168 RepID=A0ACC2DB71_DIPCM|nr:hypothetical protein O6H91_Y375800 [Diphasiastrum complanatum]KAJ7551440.1 hypothetical protein O6H91_06G015400 [Diphasiastrum complanatum]
MGGGGGHAVGSQGPYPGYPTEVWSPSGGWYCNPRYWRRNTAIAFAGIFLVCIPIAIKSAQLEERPVPPIRPIPSQYWSTKVSKS